MKLKSCLIVVALLPALLMGPLGCETMSEHKIVSGAAIGTAAGALAGGIIGHQTGNRTAGALIGAAAGAALGTGIGYYLDRQAKKFEQIEDVQVEKVPQAQAPETGRTRPEHLTLRLSNQVLFERGSSALAPRGTDKMQEIANILKEYPDSNVIIKGYTSSEGDDASNTALSQRRADAVKNTLISFSVNPARMQAVGLGESNPIADNATEAGKAQNRRVEIEVYPTNEGRQGGSSQDQGGSPAQGNTDY